MSEEKKIRHLRYLANKMGLSVVTGESENIFVHNTGKWRTDEYGRRYRAAFVNAKAYALKKADNGEIITPIEQIKLTKSGHEKIISDITIEKFEQMVNDLWDVWRKQYD